jgi:hypothetical protein
VTADYGDVMALRVEPGIGKTRKLSCASKRATVMGSRSAYFIRAGGQLCRVDRPEHDCTRPKRQRVSFFLRRRGRPYMTVYKIAPRGAMNILHIG